MEEVRENIKSGVIRKEKELAGDATHYHAYSVFETVVEKDESSKEQEQKKSEPRVTKGREQP